MAIPGKNDRVKKALQEFSDLLAANSKESRQQIRRRVILQYDLTPREEEFFLSQTSLDTSADSSRS